MVDYTVFGYSYSDVTISGTGGVGSTVQLAPTWDANVDAIQFDITDNDTTFSGDHIEWQVGNDSTQHADVTDGSGAPLGSGTVYLNDAFTVSDGAGNIITVYTVQINGVDMGLVTDAVVSPGTVYEITAINDVTDTNAPEYADLATSTIVPDGGYTYTGGAYDDTISAGDLGDTIFGGAGADVLDGGAGNDYIEYGTGGATQADGDIVYGGDGDDTIDDAPGISIDAYDDVLYGGAGNDVIYSGGGDDILYGDADDDILHGEDGNDTLYGGTGNDTIYDGAGDDTAYGGDGNDNFIAGSGTDTLYGEAGNDIFNVSTYSDTTHISGGDGYDYLSMSDSSGAGVSVVFTGSSTFTYDYNSTATTGTVTGIEVISTSSNNDTVDASANTDNFDAHLGSGDDLYLGGSGSDRVWGNSGNDTIYGGAGNDFFSGDAGDDTIYGDADRDIFYFSNDWGNDAIFGGGTGNDTDTLDFTNVSSSGITITFTGWEDGTATDGTNTVSFDNIESIQGSNQNDTIDASLDGSGLALYGNGGDDTIIAGSGDDVVGGGAGNDTLTGGAGNDIMSGSSGDDVLYGGAGNDQLYGNNDNDTLYGGAGDDQLHGEYGNDTIDGGDGNDTIWGGAGNDIISGGAGSDTISTGAGSDIVQLTTGDGADRITDFDMTLDAGGLTTDQLVSVDLVDGDGNPINVWDVAVSDDGSGNALLTFPSGDTLVLEGVAPAQLDTAAELYSIGIPCFVSGTRIMTPSGARAIETLKVGDTITTVDRGPLPLLWHGQRHVPHSILKQSPELLPIVIRDGTLGNRGDLLVSRQHGLVLPDPHDSGDSRIFARAVHLLKSGDNRIRVAKGCRDVTYHHLLLPYHAVVLANGAPSESLYPGAQALSGFDRAAKAELFGLFPALEAILRAPQLDLSAQIYGQTALPFATRAARRDGKKTILPHRAHACAQAKTTLRVLRQYGQPAPNRNHRQSCPQ